MAVRRIQNPGEAQLAGPASIAPCWPCWHCWPCWPCIIGAEIPDAVLKAQEELLAATTEMVSEQARLMRASTEAMRKAAEEQGLTE